jgi:two-component system sensor histidine kinase KdpD
MSYGASLLLVGACTAAAAAMEPHFDPANLTMIYLLGVVLAAVAFGRGPAVAAAVISVAVFDFVFVPPRFSFEVADTQYLVTFAVMLVVAVVIGTLTAWLRGQREEARDRERRTAALYRLSRDLAMRGTMEEVSAAAASCIGDVMEARTAVSIGTTREDLRVVAGDGTWIAANHEQEAMRRSFENGQPIPPGRDANRGMHLPLRAGADLLGVLSVESAGQRPLDQERFHLLRSLASQTALALERCRLAEGVERARVDMQNERNRSALLSSVSHDLRTPLASITGAASSLRDGAENLSRETRHELADTIAEEAMRLNRLVGNLLDMTRLESGTLRPQRDWHSLEEVIGAALSRLEPMLRDRPVRPSLPADLPLLFLDDVLFEQVVVNLVENAAHYSPPGEPIEIQAALDDGALRFEVRDHGPGIESGDEERVFEKFHRGTNVPRRAGAGLGLAICRAIVAAHGGSIRAAQRPAGGACFTVRMPLEGAPPIIEAEAPDDEPARSSP